MSHFSEALIKSYFISAMSSPEGFDKAFIEYVGQDWYDINKDTVFEELRREEFEAFLDYLRRKYSGE